MPAPESAHLRLAPAEAQLLLHAVPVCVLCGQVYKQVVDQATTAKHARLCTNTWIVDHAHMTLVAQVQTLTLVTEQWHCLQAGNGLGIHSGHGEVCSRAQRPHAPVMSCPRGLRMTVHFEFHGVLLSAGRLQTRQSFRACWTLLGRMEAGHVSP